MTIVALASMDLAALLCSRVCHDVISPVGAIVNGLEVMDLEKDEAMRADALKLVRESAARASSRLQFARLAFGAAGSAGGPLSAGPHFRTHFTVQTSLARVTPCRQRRIVQASSHFL